MKQALIEILEVTDITSRWRDYIYHFKLAASRFAKKNAKMAAENLAIGNMYTYRNLVYFEGKVIKYPIQCRETTTDYSCNSITFLN